MITTIMFLNSVNVELYLEVLLLRCHYEISKCLTIKRRINFKSLLAKQALQTWLLVAVI